jgi:hypothetical protein
MIVGPKEPKRWRHIMEAVYQARDRFHLFAPQVVNDLPVGGKRLVQLAEGYEATLVAGFPIFERGEPTGAKPDRLVRRGQWQRYLLPTPPLGPGWGGSPLDGKPTDPNGGLTRLPCPATARDRLSSFRRWDWV